MRILNMIASADPETGGPIEALRLTGLQMARLGHAVEVVTLDKPSAPYVKEFPFPVHACGRWTRKYGYTPELARWIAANADRFDAAIIHGLWNHAAAGGWSALRRAGLPYVVFTHGMMDPWFRETHPLKHIAKQAFWFAWQGRVLRDAAAVLFTCEEERRRARGVFGGYGYAERIVAFGTADPPAGVENQLAAFHRLLPGLKDKRFLLFLGRFHAKKGCALLIEAFARIAASDPDLDLVMAGPDPSGLKSKLIAQAARAGIADRIHWPGMVAGDAKWGAFRAAEAFVLPSHQENFGIVVAEAMVCATPVLLTDKVNIWREVQMSGGGLVGPDTFEGIENLLRSWLSLSGDDKSVMRARARAGFERHFRIEAAARDLVAILRSISLRGLHEAA
ncbi:glycosyltransferase [Neorhizobium galegae]|uniref:glycosyltransferase n=1 Tax=Neorhizobium galegae TaxID=399 RepID=UPI0006211526|nr:glycosyltransferase [Neorhizobium galegae]MCQ1767715.1 glycosyltransferase [Neorhizobium galegae]MCQ1848054.1 glycosyltransferase [Neorhizobium galegae]CDZ42883.1 Similar to tr/Q3MDF0/Glycosyl transferase [Neorhizobium galegae bv. officinalis]